MARWPLVEMILHPWATLRRVQGLDRLPDRRQSQRRAVNRGDYDEVDPIRGQARAEAVYKALGVYALEESRIELYENFREMDSDPMVASVLDAFAEDASQFDAEHRRIVWCESKNSQIQEVVTKTLDYLGIDGKAFPIMRSMGRDGDVLFHCATARGKGIVALRPYEPWTIARVEDDIGRLIAFAPSDEKGDPVKQDSKSIQFYQALHFRLPQRDLLQSYGAYSSFLWGSRVLWREIQLMEDQIVIQRLLRRPDRLMILMDSSGMSHDDAWMVMKDWERRFHREWYLNPSSGAFSSQGTPLDTGKDMILPRGTNNQTTVENFPATNQNDMLRDLELFLAQFAAGMGFPLGFIGRGERGDYRAEQSLSRQSQPFAKRATRLQRAFLDELVRMVMIDLAFKGLDPYHPANAFTLHMASVAPIVEIERAEVIQLKMDRMERALRFGQEANLDMTKWTRYVLERYGGLPTDVVDEMLGASEADEIGNSKDDFNVSLEGRTGRAGRNSRNKILGEAEKVLAEAVLPKSPLETHPTSSSETASPSLLSEDRFRPRTLNESERQEGLIERQGEASTYLVENKIETDSEGKSKFAKPMHEATKAIAEVHARRRKSIQTRLRVVRAMAGFPIGKDES